jgi:hypothetical protein
MRERTDDKTQHTGTGVVSGRSCGSSVVWAGRGEWNATRGLAVHGARGAQNTYRAHVEGSMGLITLIAVRCSPWCVFILPMHVFPADTYTYRPRSVTSPSRVSFYPRHTHAYMEKQIILAISATIHCYSSSVPAPCPVPGTHQTSTTGRSPSPGTLAPGTPAATLQSHARLCWFLHFAAQHGWPMPTWSQSASSESHPPAVDRFFSPSTSAF